MASERRGVGAISSLVNARGLQFKSLLVPVLMYSSVTMIWKEKERSTIMAVQMDNLRSLLGIRRMSEVQNLQRS